MKNWQNPEVMELNINMTATGGKNSSQIDGTWTDRTKTPEQSFYSMGSGGSTEGGNIEVTYK